MHYKVALLRQGKRTVVTVEADDFADVLDALIPYLADDAHISHADSSADMVHLAVLRHEQMRAQQAYNDALAAVQTEEARQDVNYADPEETP